MEVRSQIRSNCYNTIQMRTKPQLPDTTDELTTAADRITETTHYQTKHTVRFFSLFVRLFIRFCTWLKCSSRLSENVNKITHSHPPHMVWQVPFSDRSPSPSVSIFKGGYQLIKPGLAKFTLCTAVHHSTVVVCFSILRAFSLFSMNH